MTEINLFVWQGLSSDSCIRQSNLPPCLDQRLLTLSLSIERHEGLKRTLFFKQDNTKQHAKVWGRSLFSSDSYSTYTNNERNVNIYLEADYLKSYQLGCVHEMTCKWFAPDSMSGLKQSEGCFKFHVRISSGYSNHCDMTNPMTEILM